MGALDDLAKSITRTAAKARQVQIRFVECRAVDWHSRTMTAVGTADGVEYLDVMLGLGGECRRPAVGSLCLIGIIDGLEVAAFLLAADDVELVETTAGQVIFNGGRHGGLVIASKTAERLNALERSLNDLKKIFNTWTPATGDGGAALKTAVTAWAAESVELTVAEQLENDEIKH